MTELVKKRFFFNVNKVGHFEDINSVLRFFDRLFTLKRGKNFLGGEKRLKKTIFFNVNKVGHFKYINSVLRFFYKLFTRKTVTNFLGGGSTRLLKKSLF